MGAAQRLNSILDYPVKPALRRVPKQEAMTDTFVRPDALDVCLDCWKTWMHGDPDRNLSAKTMSGLTGYGDGHGISADEAQQVRDNQIGAATDAMIDSLRHIHRWAIYTSCSMTTTWKFPRADLATVAEEAKKELQNKLKNNCCTSVLF